MIYSFGDPLLMTFKNLLFGAAIFGQSLSLGAEAARWGLSAGSTLRYNCTTGYCQGDSQDVYGGTRQSFDRSLTSESHASYGNARAVVEMNGEAALFPKISGLAESIGDLSHWNSAGATAIE